MILKSFDFHSLKTYLRILVLLFNANRLSDNIPTMDLIYAGENCSAVTPFRCPAARALEGSMKARIVPGCPSLDRESREAGSNHGPSDAKRSYKKTYYSHASSVVPPVTQ
ncbi:hypothetical protein T265_12993, partial [Opisthorchis viverrini]